ncbi:MAG: arylesterase [Proteobacteria bacterium]|nr:arylesterase [Pseudomonadota bacterium]
MAQPQAAQTAAPNITLVAFGDSIFAGYDLRPEQAFPAKLEKALREKGYAVQVVGRAVSGDTTADGLTRVDYVLQSSPHIVILELGGNDLLRGVQPETVKANLDAIMYKLAASGAWIILAGQNAPLNYGKAYAEKFNGLYVELAGKYGVPLHPNILEGVMGQPTLMLPDGVHPNALGVEVIVGRIMPLVEQILNKR